MVLIYLAVNGCLQEQTAVLWKEPKHNLALESKDEGDLSKTDMLPGELKRAKCVITTIKSAKQQRPDTDANTWTQHYNNTMS